MSSYEEDAFPVSVAWSLADGCIKTTLICPEESWLEQAGHLDIDPDMLELEGHSPKAVLEELQQDRGDEPLYCYDFDQTQQALDQLYNTLEGYNDLPLQPLMDLLEDVSADEIEACREECLSLLEFDPYSAESQVRLWQQVYARLSDD
ncbi:MAG: hypothetical protein V7752_02875 [Halopseudomonas sp.]